MIVGIDIDDVLYNTSYMIKHLTPKLLDDMGVKYTVNENAYLFRDMYGLTDEQCRAIENKLEWTSLEYINSNAILALKRVKQAQPDIDFHIVTWRAENETIPIIQLIKQYYYLDITAIHCLPSGTNKAAFCDNNGISIMLDDYEQVIRSFTSDTKCRGVLVAASEHVRHNKAFADAYHTVLTDWDELINLCLEAKKSH